MKFEKVDVMFFSNLGICGFFGLLVVFVNFVNNLFSDVWVQSSWERWRDFRDSHFWRIVGVGASFCCCLPFILLLF